MAAAAAAAVGGYDNSVLVLDESHLHAALHTADVQKHYQVHSSSSWTCKARDAQQTAGQLMAFCLSRMQVVMLMCPDHPA